MVVTRRKKPVRKAPRQPWTIEKGLSYSSLSTFNRNREEFRLSYVEGWYYPGLIFAMEWGSMFHYLLEHDGSVNRIIKNYKAKNWTPARRRHLTSETVDDLDRLSQETAMMLPHYKKFWKAEDSKCSWVKREKWFEIHVDVDGRSIPLRGVIDGVYTKNKGLWVFETKTKGRIEEEALTLELSSDFQVMMYCLAVQRAFNKEPVGIRYNVIKRPGLYRRKDEKLRDFVSRAETDVIADPAKYFKRWRIELKKGDVERWLNQQLLPMLRNFLAWYDGFSSPEQMVKDPFSNPLHFKGSSDSLYIKAAKTNFHKALSIGDFSGLIQKGG